MLPTFLNAPPPEPAAPRRIAPAADAPSGMPPSPQEAFLAALLSLDTPEGSPTDPEDTAPSDADPAEDTVLSDAAHLAEDPPDQEIAAALIPAASPPVLAETKGARTSRPVGLDSAASDIPTLPKSPGTDLQLVTDGAGDGQIAGAQTRWHMGEGPDRIAPPPRSPHGEAHLSNSGQTQAQAGTALPAQIAGIDAATRQAMSTGTVISATNASTILPTAAAKMAIAPGVEDPLDKPTPTDLTRNVLSTAPTPPPATRAGQSVTASVSPAIDPVATAHQGKGALTPPPAEAPGAPSLPIFLDPPAASAPPPVSFSDALSPSPRALSEGPVTLPDLRQALAQRISNLTAADAPTVTVNHGTDGTRTTEVELSPADLGRLRMVLQTNEKGLHLAVLVERPEALEAVRRHLEGLHRSLVSEGVTLGSIDIGSGRREGTAQQSDSQTRQTDPRGTPEGGSEDIASDPPAPRPRAAGRLDLSF